MRCDGLCTGNLCGGCQSKWLKRKINTRRGSFIRVLYPVIGLFAWTVFSFAMVEISIENFNNEENYLM